MLFIWTKTLIYSMYAAFITIGDIHPIYISSTEVDYNTKSKSLEISVKIFADDLEPVLSKKYNSKIELGTDREHPKTKDYLMEYLQKHLVFYIDNKTAVYKYIGHESGGKSDMFALYIYLEINNINTFKIMQIYNNLLIEQHSNQLNFISCHTKNKGLIKVIAKKGDLKKEVIW
jgi:hypothetical protein